MELSANVFDVWAFRRSTPGVEYLLLRTSQTKADRFFSGGRFWQIPSGFVDSEETMVGGITRRLGEFGLTPAAIWAAEHTYIIYNRRFESMQIIGVYAAEVEGADIQLDPAEHSDYGWYGLEDAMRMVHYRGLKDGLRSVEEYITGPDSPARELQLL
jgi:ADP-ribose pyrophosphatase YjhB (NUDIX family)